MGPPKASDPGCPPSQITAQMSVGRPSHRLNARLDDKLGCNILLTIGSFLLRIELLLLQHLWDLFRLHLKLSAHY